MKITELIHELARDNGVSLSRLAIDAGLSKNYFTAQKAKQSTPKTEQVIALLNAAGYRLVAIPGDIPDSDLPDDSHEITAE